MVSSLSLVGRSLEFGYDRNNYDVEGIPHRVERRRVRVEGIRDTEAVPIDPVTKELNPLQRRGRYLLECFDYDKHAVRSFYWNWMLDIRIVDEPAAAEELPDTPQAVFIIDRPEGWAPAACDELPPSVRETRRESPQLAAVFAKHFNELEMQEPAGRWAITGFHV
jgi:hypothetical protein